MLSIKYTFQEHDLLVVTNIDLGQANMCININKSERTAHDVASSTRLKISSVRKLYFKSLDPTEWSKKNNIPGPGSYKLV